MKKILLFASTFLVVIPAVAQIWPFEKTDRQIIHEGNIEYAKGNYDAALKNYEKVTLLKPGNPYASYNIGSAAYKGENYDEAIRYYKNALSKVKTDQEKSSLYYNLGNAHYQKKETEKSIEAYKNALKLDPKNEDARYNLSYIIQEQNKQKSPPPQGEQNQPPPEPESKPQMNEKEAENILDDLDDEEKKMRKNMNNKGTRNDREKDW